MALTITLTGGMVSLEVDADLTSLNEYDRRFVLEMIGLLLARVPSKPPAEGEQKENDARSIE